MKEKLQFDMNKMLLLFALIPLFVAIVAMTLISCISLKNNLELQTKQTLRTAAEDLNSYYEYDLLNNIELDENGWVEYETEYLDHLKNDGIELTLFKGDTRFCTSIIGTDGKRIEGTKASDDVIAEVINKGNDYYSDNIVINGVDYYVYYTPMKNTEGEVVGMAFAGKTCHDVDTALNKIFSQIMVSVIIIIVFFVILVLFFAKKVITPLSKVSERIETMAKGELTDTEGIHSTLKETKKLINSSETLQINLTKILTEVNNTSGSLVENIEKVTELGHENYTNAENIASTVKELSNGAMAMADSVQNTNSQVIEMAQDIDEISNKVTTLNKSSKNMQEASNEANNNMKLVSDNSMKSVDAIQAITKQINDTNDAINKINETVTFITDISSQTNLLALNASIEAARAGESGRGFAVVAEEIKKLSEQSANGANQIKEIVQEIVQKSKVSVDLAKNVSGLIEKEQVSITDTQKKVTTLLDEINNSIEQIGLIDEMTQSLNQIKMQIANNLSDLSAISEENAASNEQVSASVTSISSALETISNSNKEMNERARNLSEVIAYFRV